jgi:hypothetical protein
VQKENVFFDVKRLSHKHGMNFRGLDSWPASWLFAVLDALPLNFLPLVPYGCLARTLARGLRANSFAWSLACLLPGH